MHTRHFNEVPANDYLTYYISKNNFTRFNLNKRELIFGQDVQYQGQGAYVLVPHFSGQRLYLRILNELQYTTLIEKQNDEIRLEQLKPYRKIIAAEKNRVSEQLQKCASEIFFYKKYMAELREKASNFHYCIQDMQLPLENVTAQYKTILNSLDDATLSESMLKDEKEKLSAELIIIHMEEEKRRDEEEYGIALTQTLITSGLSLEEINENMQQEDFIKLCVKIVEPTPILNNPPQVWPSTPVSLVESPLLAVEQPSNTLPTHPTFPIQEPPVLELLERWAAETRCLTTDEKATCNQKIAALKALAQSSSQYRPTLFSISSMAILNQLLNCTAKLSRPSMPKPFFGGEGIMPR